LVVAVGARAAFFRGRFRALPEFVICVCCAGAFFELVTFVERVRARALCGGVVGGVVFVFSARFRETIVFVVRVFRDFRAGQVFGGRLFDLVVAVARVDVELAGPSMRTLPLLIPLNGALRKDRSSRS
jgi:hypothetical protein